MPVEKEYEDDQCNGLGPGGSQNGECIVLAGPAKPKGNGPPPKGTGK